MAPSKGFKSFFSSRKANASTTNKTTPDKKEGSDSAQNADDSVDNTLDRSASNEESSRTKPKVEIKHDVLINHMSRQQQISLWISKDGGTMEGVLLRKEIGVYMACPSHLATSRLAYYCTELNLQAAMTVNSRVVKAFLQWNPDAKDVPISGGLKIQVLPDVEALQRARKNQFAAFLKHEKLLIVWDDEPLNVIKRSFTIEEDLMAYVMQADKEDGEDCDDEPDRERSPEEDTDEENGGVRIDNRPTRLLNSILVAFSLMGIVAMLGAGARQIVVEIMVDKNWMRLGFLALIPIQVWFTLFFTQVIVGCIAELFGPVQQMHTNSRYYSAILPPRLKNCALPHITIQCPVYKEGLVGVIGPTVRSIKQAMSTYELQGGSSNLFINDDGMRVIDEDERKSRKAFYRDHNIAWTARPPEGENGYHRKGKFKKASNMNVGFRISNAVEQKLGLIERPEGWSIDDEEAAYELALEDSLKEQDGAFWASGDVRIGDYILLVDSDTRVPRDCLLDAASEMEHYPEVGILQFSSGVMQVCHTYFENGITFFTNLIYTAIRYTVANGDVAPFVGHNAILRWSALQEVSFEEDGIEKFWSESHVSEDFDMALRLQVNGYIIRFATWAGEGFKEGVSLTVYDELARWEKYAYGCNELLFHPLKYWFTRGPFTALFRRFIFSNIRITSKITILSYIGTYYAIASAWILTTTNYFAMGWYNGYLDKYYIDSWQVWFSIVLVFNGLGNVALAVMRYRLHDRTFMGALLENIKWIPLLAIFLGGLSLHLSAALLSHFFSINVTWGATSKELENSNFWKEVPKVLRRFKFSIMFALTCAAMMVLFGVEEFSFIPWHWRIRSFVAIVPLCTVAASHLLLPMVLNPALMEFSW